MERCYNVLIADSNEAFCEELAQRLTGAEGFAVAGIATDGQRAVDLLGKTTHSMQFIAEQCGFTDANYFTRTFKKINGISTVRKLSA